MTKRTSAKLVLSIFLLAGAAATAMLLLLLNLSSSEESANPWRVHIGVDKCHECGMIISDIRYAAVAKRTDSESEGQTLRFDDIGCFFSTVQKHPSSHWDGAVFHYESGAKIPLDIARFEQGEYHTPMGSGWIAHSDSNSGKSFAGVTGAFSK